MASIDVPQLPTAASDAPFSETSAATSLQQKLVQAGQGTILIKILMLAEKTGIFPHLASAGARGMAVAELARRCGARERYVQELTRSLLGYGILCRPPLCSNASREQRGREAVDHGQAEESVALAPGSLETLCDPDSPLGSMGMVQLVHGVTNHTFDAVLGCISLSSAQAGVPFDAFGSDVVAGIRRLNRPAIVANLNAWFAPFASRLRAGCVVADVGCGTGQLLIALAARHPLARFVGYDLSSASIEIARAAATDAGLTNVAFEVRDITDLPESAFDLVTTFDVVHDVPKPAAALVAIRASLKPAHRSRTGEEDAEATVVASAAGEAGATDTAETANTAETAGRTSTGIERDSEGGVYMMVEPNIASCACACAVASVPDHRHDGDGAMPAVHPSASQLADGGELADGSELADGGAVADGGDVAELHTARAGFLHGISTLHCLTQSLSAGGAGLGAAWGRSLQLQYLQNAGFEDVQKLTGRGFDSEFSVFWRASG